MKLNQLIIFTIVALLLIFNACAEAGDPVGPQQPCKPDTVFINNFDFDPMVIEIHDTVQVPVFLVDSVFVKDTVLVELQSSYTDYGISFRLNKLFIETDYGHANKYKQHDLHVIGQIRFHLFKHISLGWFMLLEDSEYSNMRGVEGVSVGLSLPVSGLLVEGDYLYGERFGTRGDNYWMHGFNVSVLYRANNYLSVGPTYTWFRYTASDEGYPFVAIQLNL